MRATLISGTPRALGSGNLRRLIDDTHIRLAIGIAAAAVLIELVPMDSDTFLVAIVALAFVGVELGIGSRKLLRSRPTIRLLIAVGFISLLSLIIGDVDARPMATLYLPVIAMAASFGFRQAIVVGAASFFSFGIPFLMAMAPTEAQLQRFAALVVTTVVLAVGVRRTVDTLENAIARARRSRTREHRRARQMAGIEDVGRVLAAGVSTVALEETMDLLVTRFGYELVAIFVVGEDGAATLGAQRGYDDYVDGSNGAAGTTGFDGVIGRVVRTHETAFVRDVTLDPEYRAANAAVRSEIAVPMLVAGELLGVLNVEHREADGLDETDRSTLVLVAERLAAAIALGRERQALQERAALFQSLAEFSRIVNGSLENRDLKAVVVEAVARILSSDIVTLVTRDAATGEDRIATQQAGDQRYLGVRILPGEGTIGRAIERREVVTSDHLDRGGFPSTVRGADIADPIVAAAVPLILDEAVVGALGLCRTDLARPYTALEREVLPIVAGQVSLALANAELHATVADLAIRDSLTGLFNRRHLDAALVRMLAARERLSVAERRPIAAIMFDLDHFGAFNKQHGHRIGDAVLRTFGLILQTRFRTSDIVARFGGEEFLVILDGATLDEATKIADDVRRSLAATSIPLEDGGAVIATVSAGCSALGPDVSALSSLLEVADVGLQMAKRAGRNQIVAA